MQDTAVAVSTDLPQIANVDPTHCKRAMRQLNENEICLQGRVMGPIILSYNHFALNIVHQEIYDSDRNLISTSSGSNSALFAIDHAKQMMVWEKWQKVDQAVDSAQLALIIADVRGEVNLTTHFKPFLIEDIQPIDELIAVTAPQVPTQANLPKESCAHGLNANTENHFVCAQMRITRSPFVSDGKIKIGFAHGFIRHDYEKVDVAFSSSTLQGTSFVVAPASVDKVKEAVSRAGLITSYIVALSGTTWEVLQVRPVAMWEHAQDSDQ